ASPTSGVVPLTVALDGSASTDPDGTIVTWDWTDGTQTTTGETASMTFTTPGIHTVELTVTDNDGATNTDTVEITTQAPPPPLPIPPPAQDPELFVIGGQAVTPDAIFQHLDRCVPTDRLSGSNRYATAQAVLSLESVSGGTVFVVNGETFPDALGAGAAANIEESALLLVKKWSVPSATTQALDSISPDKIVIVGGTAVVSTKVESQLRARYGDVERVAGSNRYNTAVELSKYQFVGRSHAAIIVTGTGFVDALASAPLAYAKGAPVLLVPDNGVPTSVLNELKRLSPTTIYIVGGTAAVSSSIENTIEAATGTNVTRVAGSNRYRTARAIADLLPGTQWRMIAVPANNFPDGLTAGGIARMNPIILTGYESLNSGTSSTISEITGKPCAPRVKLSSFTTYHPCCANRVTNIQLIADTIDDTTVLPGRTFSVNGATGQRTEAKGYKRAGAIVGGKIVCCDSPVNVGGGTSQYTTTLYNAVFYAGLEDVFHRPHSIYFTRYPKGIEATLNWTSPDLKFRNDTEWPVMINSHHTGTSITVELWGWSDGRTVKKSVTGSASTSQGGRVVIKRWVTYGDGSVRQQTWYHTYRPIA
ncbi:MAG: cell wall-binding repeat-containing protein, partial [Actinomycetia bacterium]|nr:cell wall-binding repeat-containing protein [Actinomycetes bacterium]